MSRSRKKSSSDKAGGRDVRIEADEPRVGHTIMFWFLMGLGFLTFAPCVLLPAWVRYAQMHRQEQVMAARVKALEEKKALQERTIAALRTDPAVNERVAVRDLRYKRPGARMATVRNETQSAELLDVVAPVQVNVVVQEPAPPGPAAWARRYLPELPLREVFCVSPSREVALSMSIGLMVLAFWLYTPRRGMTR